ncbi:hypothetical protein TNCV_2805731 [Trichonephila clavipes]|nr:hypothetical protein TNCV_2805731 [Trichonephila clavipes]
MRSIGKGAEAGRNVLWRNESSTTTYKVFSPYTVAVDGTWQKRGYTSLNDGVVTVTSIDTGDGDCKAFDAVKKNIYGNEYPIEKLGVLP